ncbi:hypothetical protein Bca52824_021837 [Brassica carinata]|uniref:KIB1-4 beta-propeller domain-containing protein n=1 Tax=Brassica carinata TaxID=52824 RepID=A0A8X7VF40_BRACI|nr:hypothetical protein Bca52824_021837 [Brassica carinata]
MKELDGSTMHLTNMFNPCASLSSHEVITLPPSDDSETLISSISLSASPNQQKEEDCVVAARSSLGFLILCRPGDSAWTRVEAPFCTPYLMYSERDGGPLEDLKSSSGFPPVSLYTSFPSSSSVISSYTKKSKSFMVFRQDPERKTSSYTEDIGDLCIFVGNSEAICISATEYPGLEANSVYYADFSIRFGFYNLSSNTLHDLTDEAVASSLYMWLAPLQ